VSQIETVLGEFVADVQTGERVRLIRWRGLISLIMASKSRVASAENHGVLVGFSSMMCSRLIPREPRARRAARGASPARFALSPFTGDVAAPISHFISFEVGNPVQAI
jgi:hypothetical protein